MATQQLDDQIARFSQTLNDLREEVGRVLVGQDHMLSRLLVGLLTGGHVLLEGLPGLAKTLTIRSLATAIDTGFSRIQFTPDMLPADVIGTEVFNPKDATYQVRKGPIFSNLVLADEINRAPAKVQAALLEAMQERQGTIGGETFELEEPFLVLATQNPIEQEGTYPLPEAQVDRFMLKVLVEYPTKEEERKIVDRMASGQPVPEVRKVAKPEDVLQAREVVDKIWIDEKVRDYLVDVARATRDPAQYGITALEYLTNASERSVLFIDEIHRLPKAVEEYLYTAMEDYRIDIVLGEGTNARTLNISLAAFTLIGATTRVGLLSAPLRDRFQIREHLEFYNDDELAEIVRRSAHKLKVEIDDESAIDIARRSRGTPRVANNHLRWVRDYATSKADGKITIQVTHAALKMAAVDAIGLRREDRKYLETLIRVFNGGPAGVEAIAHTMNAATDTLEDEIEPFLLRKGLVVRTPRGRIVRTAAYEHLRIDPPHESDQGDSGQQRLF